VPIGNFVNSGGLDYTVYGADVSALAGLEETLMFSATTGDGILDDIQFSSMIVPEPPTMSLIFLLGGLLIYARHRSQERRRALSALPKMRNSRREPTPT
jgi:hypothetical protein